VVKFSRLVSPSGLGMLAQKKRVYVCLPPVKIRERPTPLYFMLELRVQLEATRPLLPRTFHPYSPTTVSYRCALLISESDLQSSISVEDTSFLAVQPHRCFVPSLLEQKCSVSYDSGARAAT
jgi:hypothetical protein